ncbi:unnamed protein product [Nippostrongylus brasiliensis]|uniref:Integrase catalytic domain-containing protein n=1 Tax=Nippostrongylus brasiliensis TaxID=27835 RepID=A0A0N4XWG3_NIPBR|nr:unnamed protein product [Nippostrongylus brasiliensis]
MRKLTKRIINSDKGGDFVVSPQEKGKTITAIHHQCNSVYAKSTCKEIAAQFDRLKRTWTSIPTEARFDPKHVTELKSTGPICPVICTFGSRPPTGDAINDPSQFKYNVFKWSNNYYKQVSGLAVVQRLATVPAIAFRSKIETPILERKPL